MTETEYRALDRVCQSDLATLDQSPAHYQHRKRHPSSTPAMVLGSAIHAIVLEPDTFGDRYAIAPNCDRRTKAGKALHAEFIAEHGEKVVLTQEQSLTVHFVREAVMAHPGARNLIGDAQVEQVRLWTDQATGLECKALVDITAPFDGLLADLKTTRDCRAFARSIDKYRYYLQVSFYLWGHAESTGQSFEQWRWITVETTPPYPVIVYEPDEELLDFGAREIRRLLDLFDECTITNHWPGYPTETQVVGLPAWRKT